MSAAESPFDPLAVALEGQTVVEASAGTGKTYTLGQLYLRLVLERGLAPKDILVVTYTVAATEDLRRKLRERLVAAQPVLAGDAEPDPFLAGLLARLPDRAAAAAALARALTTLDEAAIHTIHGFCQRILADHAFESGQPFDGDILPDEAELVQEVVDDHWRRAVAEASPPFADYLLEKREGPDRLLEHLGAHLGRTDVRVLAPEVPAPAAEVEARHAAAWRDARALWLAERATIEARLVAAVQTKQLSGVRYKLGSLPGWFELVNGYFASETPRIAALAPLDKLRADRLREGRNKSGTPPAHAFFDVVETLETAGAQLRDGYEARRLALRRALLEAAPEALAQRKRRRGLLSYDDLLRRVAAALDAPGGAALAATVRRRWRAALVDEFQDTDPVQYAILRRVWGDGGGPLVLVGDPKQAIYAFRGADLYAYLRARAEATARWPLDRNWRSDAPLLAAVNAIFRRAERPFLLDDVEFRAAQPADRGDRKRLVVPDDAAPFTVWFLGREPGGPKVVPKPQARLRAAAATAAEIARLLRAAAAGTATYDGRPLAGGDVAVLVRTHREGRLVRDALLGLGIPSVQHAQDSVLASREARELELVLRAAADPGAEGAVRAALATEMLGRSGAELERVAGDEAAWSTILLRFQGWRQRWREKGFVQMFRALLADEQVAPRLLAFGDGERRLTNVLHLGELLQEAASTRPGGPEALVAWMAERRAGGRVESDEHQLRLESDEHLVRIVTIHKSKGLEYPIVFCPFVWDGRLMSDQLPDVVHHDAERRRCLSLGVKRGNDDPAREAARTEELAERLRLLYVALTRAEHRCTIVWGGAGDAGFSALAWLLGDPARDDDKVAARASAFRERSDADLRADLDRLVRASDGAIRVVPLPDGRGERLPSDAVDAAALAPRRLVRPVPASWAITSFTTLAAGRRDEGPDHDADPGAVVAPAPPDVFPPGAAAGRCLHGVLEHLVPETAGADARRAVVRRQLQAHGFAPAWEDAVLGLAERALATPLDAAGRVRVGGVPARERLAELEFTYRLGRFDVGGLRALLRAHPLGGGAFDEAARGLRFDAVAGFLRGYVDLLFRADGRWWLLDWKSNWLGPSPDDYTPARLAGVMAREAYWLQYLVYAVVARRFLARRVPGFDWERDFGGVFYVFLRGLEPARGAACGVFHDRPSAALVEALDAWMGGA
ncbi:MAG: exodeoxyribonuclease V subunit beta [bacterium]|nr:exodeoxyribonuclease V subunit beta [bacterium]